MKVEHKNKKLFWLMKKPVSVRAAARVKNATGNVARWLRRPVLSPSEPHSKSYGH